MNPISGLRCKIRYFVIDFTDLQHTLIYKKIPSCATGDQPVFVLTLERRDTGYSSRPNKNAIAIDIIEHPSAMVLP